MKTVAELADIVKRFESGGDYTAQNKDSSASGAYQFITPTWRRYASAAGVDTNAYPTAAAAPPAVQDAVFKQAVTTNGLKDWTCPGCDPALSKYLAGEQVSLPPTQPAAQPASVFDLAPQPAAPGPGPVASPAAPSGLMGMLSGMNQPSSMGDVFQAATPAQPSQFPSDQRVQPAVGVPLSVAQRLR